MWTDKINKIWCGDCLDLMKEMPDKCIDLIITDPPYLITKESWDKKEVFNQEIINEMWRVLKMDGQIYIWCGIGEKSQSLIRWFPLLQKQFIFRDLITWKKQRGVGMRKGWLYAREECMWFSKGKNYIWNKEYQYTNIKRKKMGFKNIPKNKNLRISNVWTDIKENLYSNGLTIKSKKQLFIAHYTSKPIELIKRILKVSSNEKDLIFDPFMGSWTTARACMDLKRNFIGAELSEEYCKIGENRLKQQILI